MGLIAAANGSQTATINTEHSLSQQTGIGIYVLLVNTAAMASGDALTLKIKTKRSTGDAIQTAYVYSFTDAQTEPHKYSVPVPVDTEIVCTLTQTAGTGRAFPWKLLRA